MVILRKQIQKEKLIWNLSKHPIGDLKGCAIWWDKRSVQKNMYRVSLNGKKRLFGHLLILTNILLFLLNNHANISKKNVFSDINHGLTVGLLICTLISENQGLEKSRSTSNLEEKLDLYHKPKKNPGDKLKKNPGCRTWNFSKVWNRP